MALPSGYIQLKYISSSGSQYIEIPYKANSGLSVTMAVNSGYYSGTGALFGARDSSNAIGVYRTATSDTSGYIQYGSCRQDFSNFPARTYTTPSCRVFVSNTQMTVNDLVTYGGNGWRVNYDISPSAFETNLSLYLLAENYNGIARYKHRAELCSVIINNYPLIPCMQASTGKPGLYDTYNGAFYASASDVDFTAGPAVTTSLPSTYTQTDYVETTGTQYIDTGYVPNSTTRVVLDFESTGADFGCLFGARTASNSGDSKNTFGMWVQDATAFPHYGDGVYNQKPITKPVNTRLTIDMNGATTTIGDTSVTFDSATFDSGCNLTLFGMNTMGSIDSRRAVGKLYSCKIYSGSTLMRDFVPCINPSGVAGLWDKLTGAFYSSAEGVFTVGKNHRVLIDGTGYEIKSGRVLIAGTGYDIKKGRTLIDGTGYDISFGTPIGELPVGSSVYMNVDGVRKEWLVVHQGKPISTPVYYDDTCAGTWLLLKDIYTLIEYAFENDTVAGGNRLHYEYSKVDKYLRETFLPLLDPHIQALIKQINLPLISRGATTSGANTTVPRQTFLLSRADLGCGYIYGQEYESLAYFPGSTSSAQEKRIAYYNGEATDWHIRDDVSSYMCTITALGAQGWNYEPAETYLCGVRPALVLPQEDAKFDDNFDII